MITLSRFLVRPTAQCRDPASKLPGMPRCRLPANFEQRYGYWMVLSKIHVDGEQYAGTCSRAENRILAANTVVPGFRTSSIRPSTALSRNLLFVKHLRHSCCGQNWRDSEWLIILYFHYPRLDSSLSSFRSSRSYRSPAGLPCPGRPVCAWSTRSSRTIPVPRESLPAALPACPRRAK